MTLKNAKAKGRAAEHEVCRLLDSYFGDPDAETLAFRPYGKEGETDDPGDIENSLGLPLVVQVKNLANPVNGLSQAMAGLRSQVRAEERWKRRPCFGLGAVRVPGKRNTYLFCWDKTDAFPGHVKVNGVSPDVRSIILQTSIVVEYRGFFVGDFRTATYAFEEWMRRSKQ